MRPLRLKIKGLNSFLELQDIDFEKLTQEGIFGIFGPTGSGKSSILDGITLALYGTTARNSGNFIHVSTDRALVEYLFSVKDKSRNLYRVSRSFKRSKEGTIRSETARITVLTETGEQVLADRVTAVNEVCKEVLGLSKEDFFRTVVLPQGKFSEFLKLEGMERNKMLERLFGLEKYGEQLVFLIKNQENLWEGKKKEKEGALSRYALVTEETLSDCQKKQQTQEALLKEKKQQFFQVGKRLEETQWILAEQENLNALLLREEKLLLQKEAMKALEQELLEAEKAEKLWEYAENKKYAEQKHSSYKEKHKKVQEDLQEQLQLLNQCAAHTEALEKKAKEELPRLEKRKEELLQAQEFLKKKKEQEILYQNCLEQQKHLKQLLGESTKTVEDSVKKKELCQKERQTFEEEIQALFLSVKEQEEIREGFSLWKEKNALQEQLLREQAKLTELSLLKAQAKNQWETSLKQESALRQQESQFKEQMEANTQELGRIPNLEEKRSFLLTAETEQEIYERFLSQEKALEESCRHLQEEALTAKEEQQELEQQLEKIKNTYRDNLAKILLADLKEGEPCPVCGNTHHLNKAVPKETESLKQIEQKQQRLQKNYQNILGKTAALSAKISTEEKERKRLSQERQKRNPLYLELDIPAEREILETMQKHKNRLEEEIAAHTAWLDQCRNKIQKIRTESVKWETQAESYQSQETDCQKHCLLLKEQFRQIEETYQHLKESTGIDDFSVVYKELLEKNQKRELLQRDLQKKLEEADRLEQGIQRQNQLIRDQEKALTDADFQVQATKMELSRLVQCFQETSKGVLEEELSQTFLQLSETQKKLEEQEQQAKEKFLQIKENTENLRLLEREYQALTETAGKDYEEKNLLLQKKLQEQKMEESWIFAHRRAPEELRKKETFLHQFRETEVQIRIEKNAIQEKLQGKHCEKEDLDFLEQEKHRLEQDVAKETQALGALKKEQEQLLEDYRERAVLEEGLKKILHRLDLLKELDHLFKGKKFVEYVSRYYLEAISKEADDCLKDMTGNCYGMETDGNGLFVIRDYKNGGAVRPSSTLSGGETFMASLALAFALASGMQMKNSALMEFFFLDEGFGTLDESCLDVVMEALERVRAKKRSVGIITHVEEIKSRIPARLLVEPARLGESGSHISLEFI